MIDHGDQSSWTPWQWLDEKGWLYLPMMQGYQSPCGRHYIPEDNINRYPGDVINFLKTGHIRNLNIFATGWMTPDPARYGLRAHKDGTCVQLRIVK